MKSRELSISGVVLIEPAAFGDTRGFFMELWSAERYREAGVPEAAGATPGEKISSFVQDNLSRSARGVLRGLHLQNPHGQGKLVSVLEGEVFDVAVDVRRGSPTFGKWVAERLSADNHRQLYVPAGCAHGFCVLSESALFTYKCTDTYHPEAELGVAYDDPELGIEWPGADFLLSDKDRKLPRLKDVDESRLPEYCPG